MATTIEELQKKLNSNTYTPKTDEQIQTEAQNKYKGAYEQNKLNAQQAYDTTAQQLRNQLATLGTAYDRQAEAAKEATAASISAADRRSIGRGMQRSSYNAATLANLQNQGNETLADIQEDRTAAEAALAEQQKLAAEQLQQQLAQLDSSYATDVQAAIDALKEQEYARQTESDQYVNNLLMQLYEMEEASRANDLALKLQEEQLKAAQRENGTLVSAGSSGAPSAGSSSSGTSSNKRVTGSSSGVVPTATQTDNSEALSLLERLSGLNGNSGSTLANKASAAGSGLMNGLRNLLGAAAGKASTPVTNNKTLLIENFKKDKAVKKVY